MRNPGVSVLDCPAFGTVVVVLLTQLGSVTVLDGPISKVSEDSNTTAVPDKVVPLLSITMVLARLAEVDRVNVALALAPVELPDVIVGVAEDAVAKPPLLDDAKLISNPDIVTP